MWAGTDYNEAYSIILFLVTPVTILLIQNLGIEIQKAKNMHQFRLWIYFLIVIGNIFLSILFTKVYGGVEAGARTTISFLIYDGAIDIIVFVFQCGFLV